MKCGLQYILNLCNQFINKQITESPNKRQNPCKGPRTVPNTE